jgi:hypothetical protein
VQSFVRLLSEFAHEAVGSLTTIICNIKYTYLYTSDISFFRTGKRERENERESNDEVKDVHILDLKKKSRASR